MKDMGDEAKHPVLLLTRKFEPTVPTSTDAVDGQDEESQHKRQHSNLTKSILKLSKKKDNWKPNSEQRTEFASKVSEFTFKGGVEGSVKVDIRDLSRPLTARKRAVDDTTKGDADVVGSNAAADSQPARTDKKGSQVHREVRSLKARQPARAPLVKHKEEKLLRQVGYNVAVDEVKKWKGVVKRNREAETVSFPLEQPSFNVSSTQELVQRFKPRTPLELEVAKLLNGSESVLGQDRILTVREERALKAMDLEEAERKRAELKKMRSLQSYAQVRSKRQGKIKSKRYHRRLRKAKEGENAKIYEELEKSHPERFQEMLEKMERKRVEERMNQRHKNNSKWVKSMMKLGKKDSEARTALNEALETSRKLTEKRPAAQSDDEEGEEEEEEEEATQNGDAVVNTNGVAISGIANNPWLRPSGPNVEKRGDGSGGTIEEETISSMYPKLEEIRNRRDSSSDEEGADDDAEEEDVSDDVEKGDAEDLPTVRDDDDETLVEKEERIVAKMDVVKEVPSITSSAATRAQEVDPTKILLRAPEVVSSAQLPTLASYENDIDGDEGGVDGDEGGVGGDDDEARQRLTIEEAFADDDVVAEFASAKSTVVERQTPKAVCTALPGWGDWVGGKLEGISVKRKRKFTERPEQPQKARKDKDKPRVIINERHRDNKLMRHLVSDIPTRDFDSVEEFEKSIRAPVGRTWNAEAAYQKLIVPNVTTKMGTVIDPINKEKTFVREEEEANSGEDEDDLKVVAKRKKSRRGGKKDGKNASFKKSDKMNKTNGKKKAKGGGAAV